MRGHRVDLQEIENVMLEDEAVSNAVVTLLPSSSNGGGELAAYVTERVPTLEDDGLMLRLHDALRRRLPAYMVPAFLEVVADLPMLASGKVDRSRLPDLERVASEAEEERRIIELERERLGTGDRPPGS